jgi:hypothetical protein
MNVPKTVHGENNSNRYMQVTITAIDHQKGLLYRVLATRIVLAYKYFATKHLYTCHPREIRFICKRVVTHHSISFVPHVTFYRHLPQFEPNGQMTHQLPPSGDNISW